MATYRARVVWDFDAEDEQEARETLDMILDGGEGAVGCERVRTDLFRRRPADVAYDQAKRGQRAPRRTTSDESQQAGQP